MIDEEARKRDEERLEVLNAPNDAHLLEEKECAEWRAIRRRVIIRNVEAKQAAMNRAIESLKKAKRAGK